MEWNRGQAPTQPATQPAVAQAGTVKKSKDGFLNLRTASVVLLFCITILLVALVGFISLSDSKESQDKYVDKSKMQAVFLNGGQVYFGKIQGSNEKFMRVSDIYYLRVNQQVQPNGSTAANQDISLVKLGCELHGPQDSMIINQQQVIFWENLKADGQVAKAVADYQKQNPNGQKCDAATGGTTPTTTPSTTTPTTPTTTTPTTKKP